MKILVIDNYDSFTYNLVHALKKFDGVHVEVKRNDEVGKDEPGLYDKIVFFSRTRTSGRSGFDALCYP